MIFVKIQQEYSYDKGIEIRVVNIMDKLQKRLEIKLRNVNSEIEALTTFSFQTESLVEIKIIELHMKKRQILKKLSSL